MAVGLWPVEVHSDRSILLLCSSSSFPTNFSALGFRFKERQL